MTQSNIFLSITKAVMNSISLDLEPVTPITQLKGELFYFDHSYVRDSIISNIDKLLKRIRERKNDQ